MNQYLISQLKEGRAKKGLKQSQVADMIGIKPNTLSGWENGVTEPDIDTFLELCRIYNLDYASILEEAYDYKSPNIEFSLNAQEAEHIKKYRNLDDYGKKQVDTTLENEYTRCISESDGKEFHDYDNAYDYLTQSQMFAMGGLDIESMENEELIDFANDMYEMDKKAAKYFK